MNRKRPARRGYALMMVVMFVILFLAGLGVAWRQVASVLRTETVRQTQAWRDQGCLAALAKAVQTANITSSSVSPYVWSTTIDGRSFTVTFTQDPTDPTLWTVEAVPSP